MSAPSGPAATNTDLSTAGPAVSEPVLLAHLVTVVLGALVAVGWLTIPSATVNEIGDIVALAASTGGALLARARVTPSGRITWQAILEEIQASVYSELERVVATLADTLTAPAPPPPLAAARAMPAVTGPGPTSVSVSASGPVKVTTNPPMPIGTFTTSTGFGPAPAEPAPDNSDTSALPPAAPAADPDPAPAAPPAPQPPAG